MAERWAVYVIDDDDAVRDSLRLLLECEGYRVQAYASAIMFRSASPPDRNSCLLLDADMPGSVELLNQLRRDGITVPAIIMTDGLEPRIDAEVQVVADMVLRKPFHQGQLVACIETVLSRRATSRNV